MTKTESKGLRRGVLAARYGATRVIDAEASEQDSDRLRARLTRQTRTSDVRVAPSPPAGASASDHAPSTPKGQATESRETVNRSRKPGSEHAAQAHRAAAMGRRPEPASATAPRSTGSPGTQPLARFDQVAIVRQAEMHPDNAVSVVTAPDSPEALRYRSLLARLTPRLDRMGERKALAVISVGRSTRRSAVAANLAVLLARAGRATCLVDVGLQRGLSSRLFGLDNVTGLSEWLAGGLQLTAHQFNDLDQFTLIAGGRSSASHERLMHPRFRDWLISGFAQPGLVLLDATQLDGGADAQALASVVGHAIVVLCKDEDRLTDARAVVHELREQGVDIIGAVYLEEYID
ncbi:MAG: hypothetical protein ABF271_14610 [Abyssibacter sp.]|uniref:hypothetical protein n=1 Tax=Abyssibacter sp. TaxID=2320200 RepID=UPI003219BC42